MKLILKNRKAFHDYEILEKFQAGIVLMGSEVKSLRDGKISFKDSYVEIRNQEAFLINAHISPYFNATYNNHEVERERKLLLHKEELKKMDRKVKTRGVTIVPLSIFFDQSGFVKLEIALAKGKREYEKRQKIREKDISREMDREMKYLKK